MRRSPCLMLPVLAFAALLSSAVFAQTLPAERYEQWRRLPDDERRQMREQMREQWRQMPPEERERARQQFHERAARMPPEQREQMRQRMHEHMEQMPAEERQRMRDEMRQRREQWGHGQGSMQGPGAGPERGGGRRFDGERPRRP